MLSLHIELRVVLYRCPSTLLSLALLIVPLHTHNFFALVVMISRRSYIFAVHFCSMQYKLLSTLNI
jgi:uncharacterized protein involved in cysteine biosynthesis